MSVAVKLHDVRKRFGSLHVLNGVTFEVKTGEVAAVIGASGSGKSTALRCINGLEKIDRGEIHVCDFAVHSMTDIRPLRRCVGIVFQSYNLFPHLTVRDNITLALKYAKKLPKAEYLALAEDVLEKVGLADKAASYPDQLSGGQQQRVAIARSLAMSPKVMLFDEVTSALDPKLTGEVLRVIEHLAAGGMTMILVTHEMGFAKNVADRIVFMHQGKVVEQGSAEILARPETEELREFLKHDL